MLVFPITGMTCAKCVARVQAALTGVLHDFTVTLQPPQLVVRDALVDQPAVAKALQQAGDYQLGGDMIAEKNGLHTYWPLILIMLYLLGITALLVDTWHAAMGIFMAGYFLIFSLFKFLNLPAFAMSYARYNMLAMRWKTYGFIYPFIELALGVAYLFYAHTAWLNLLTAALMVLSGLGVVQALRQKKILRCACLGESISLPVGPVTMVEDFGMAAMALWMMVEML